MLATATHDHKRGEDVRARLAVISEIPDEWATVCRRWLRWPGAACVPDSGTGRAQRYMLLQTLVGAWPPDLDVGDEAGVGGYLQRVEKWQIKAMREAKLDSNRSEEQTSELQSLMRISYAVF